MKNTVKNSLAQLSLRWMVLQCFRTKTGIRFNHELLGGIGLDYAKIQNLEDSEASPQVQTLQQHNGRHSRPSSLDPEKSPINNEIEDLDAKAEIFDQLKRQPLWWLFEILPLQQYRKELDNSWDSSAK